MFAVVRSVELFGEGTLRRWGLAEGSESAEAYSLAWIPGLVHQDVTRQLVHLPLWAFLVEHVPHHDESPHCETKYTSLPSSRLLVRCMLTSGRKGANIQYGERCLCLGCGWRCRRMWLRPHKVGSFSSEQVWMGARLNGMPYSKFSLSKVIRPQLLYSCTDFLLGTA